MVPLHLMFAALVGWLAREQSDAITYLREENRRKGVPVPPHQRMQSNAVVVI